MQDSPSPLDIITTTTYQQPPEKSYPVDAEHGALRIAVVGVFIVVALVIYAIVSLLVPVDAGINFIGIGAGLIGAAIFTQVVDRVFKQRWPSGRKVEVYADRVVLALKDTVQRTIDFTPNAEAPITALMWRFEITKRTRIPKGWFMVALALMQDDLYLPVYTFMSPKDFENTPLTEHYVTLSSKKQQTDQDMRLAGQQRRLHMAEESRWMDGVEMSKPDFESLIEQLSMRLGDVMPTSTATK